MWRQARPPSRGANRRETRERSGTARRVTVDPNFFFFFLSSAPARTAARGQWISKVAVVVTEKEEKRSRMGESRVKMGSRAPRRWTQHPRGVPRAETDEEDEGARERVRYFRGREKERTRYLIST
ncbi:hypothetical protein PUN28_011144 [Cardiocondyla obscurior]|uniref:Uncharacterized protein n=1 Tax=Cardiocondyla obscurior TaxID=286306 RepID=A0AAW2FQD7_9HYME